MPRRSRGQVPDYPRERPTVAQVVAWRDDLYAMWEGGAGGPLHLVLDDGNLSNRTIEWCLETMDRAPEHSNVTRNLCRLIGGSMLLMTPTQKRQVYLRR